jgi:hypothetical protein
MYQRSGPTRYYVAVDLGQVMEYTAVAVVRRVAPAGWNPEREGIDRPEDGRYEVAHLKRYRPGTGFPQIVAETKELLAELPPGEKQTQLLVDATSAGPSVVALFRDAGMKPIAVTITAGFEWVEGDRYEHRVPKRDLVSALQALLQTGRLKVARELPAAALLQSEMLNFRASINLKADDDILAWRERETDDLGLAVALGCWYGETIVVRYLRVWAV